MQIMVMYDTEIVYDEEIDAIYIRFKDVPYSHGKDLDEERRIDYGINGEVRGVELHCLNQGVDLTDLPNADTIRRILEDLGIKEYVC